MGSYSYKVRLDELIGRLSGTSDELREAATHMDLTAMRLGGFAFPPAPRGAEYRGMARGLRLAATTLREDVLTSEADEV